MKSFRFTLEALRVVRQRREDLALEDYGRALLVRQKAQAQLTAAQHELSVAWERRQQLLGGGSTAFALQQWQNGCDYLQARCKEYEKGLNEATILLERRRQLFLTARREREVVDHCYKKQRQVHDAECFREEQKMIDELAVRQASMPSASRAADMLWN